MHYSSKTSESASTDLPNGNGTEPIFCFQQPQFAGILVHFWPDEYRLQQKAELAASLQHKLHKLHSTLRPKPRQSIGNSGVHIRCNKTSRFYVLKPVQTSSYSSSVAIIFLQWILHVFVNRALARFVAAHDRSVTAFPLTLTLDGLRSLLSYELVANKDA
jgi:hypothetical protein